MLKNNTSCLNSLLSKERRYLNVAHRWRTLDFSTLWDALGNDIPRYITMSRTIRSSIDSFKKLIQSKYYIKMFISKNQN